MVRRYEICVQGHLDAEWAEWFDDFTLTHCPEGVTVLAGPVIDQAALHGLLNKIGNLGLVLTSLKCVETNSMDDFDA